MDILPEFLEDFTNNEYWEQFFLKLDKNKKVNFEWYGDYNLIKSKLLESLKYSHNSNKSINILHIGCGNSNIPLELYNIGYHNIVNIDFSQNVIEKMKKLCKEYYKMKWICLDVENDLEDFANKEENKGIYDIIIDKGFLDAFLSTNILQGTYKKRGTEYFKICSKLLNNNGKYILITLCQEYISNVIIRSFYKEKVYLNIYPLFNVEDSKFLPYYIEINKIENSKNNIVMCFLNDDSSYIKSSNFNIWVLPKHIKEISALFWSKKHIKDYKPGQMIVYYLNENEKSKDNDFYKIVIYDNELEKIEYQLTAALIVPFGEELDWLYNTKKGYQELAEQVKTKRLIIISNHISNKIISNLEITNKISSYLSPLALESSGKFPILSIGDNGHIKRKCIAYIESDYCKEIQIYEILSKKRNYRQMIFTSNPRLIQSEVTILNSNNGNIEFNYLSKLSDYYIGVILASSLSLININRYKTRTPEIIILGLGGGILASVFGQLYTIDQLNITAIEIDPNVVDAAINYFGLFRNRINIIIEDAFKYIEDISKMKPNSTDIIVIDINSNNIGDPLMCPAKHFIEPYFIELMKLSITEAGCIIYNISCRDKERKYQIYQEIISNVNKNIINNFNMENKYIDSSYKLNNINEDNEYFIQVIPTTEDDVNEIWVIQKKSIFESLEKKHEYIDNFIKDNNLTNSEERNKWVNKWK
ncbi:hypothetical protein cand_005470 [Cryptosporidium andersoni]|uniref:Methyltransferase domain-containing protein n=1 Tax=Cryptosporidium andersoni TaxID=117008 RepID=A0A1J4MTC4_9CRYT|nr:hypothetical protein cand_005470 [Cryptosporidium andersoni]